jgi:hypothetical protein
VEATPIFSSISPLSPLSTCAVMELLYTSLGGCWALHQAHKCSITMHSVTQQMIEKVREVVHYLVAEHGRRNECIITRAIDEGVFLFAVGDRFTFLLAVIHLSCLGEFI